MTNTELKNLLFTAVMAILLIDLWMFLGYQIVAWQAPLFALVAYPYEHKGTVYSVFGGFSDGDIESLMGLIQDAKGDATSVLGISIFQRAGFDALHLFGFSLLQIGGIDAHQSLGFNVIQLADNEAGQTLGISFLQKSKGRTEQLFGVSVMQFAQRDAHQCAGVTLYRRARWLKSDMFSFALVSNEFDESTR